MALLHYREMPLKMRHLRRGWNDQGTPGGSPCDLAPALSPGMELLQALQQLLVLCRTLRVHLRLRPPGNPPSTGGTRRRQGGHVEHIEAADAEFIAYSALTSLNISSPFLSKIMGLDRLLAVQTIIGIIGHKTMITQFFFAS